MISRCYVYDIIKNKYSVYLIFVIK